MKPALKKRFRGLVNFKETPHRLALAFGIGVTLGVIPGTGPVAAGLVAALLRLNLPLMVGGALLTNPLTAPFVYAVSFFLGHWILGEWLPDGKWARLLLGTLTGGPVLAIGMGLVGYLFIFLFTKLIRTRHAACH